MVVEVVDVVVVVSSMVVDVLDVVVVVSSTVVVVVSGTMMVVVVGATVVVVVAIVVVVVVVARVVVVVGIVVVVVARVVVVVASVVVVGASVVVVTWMVVVVVVGDAVQVRPAALQTSTTFSTSFRPSAVLAVAEITQRPSFLPLFLVRTFTVVVFPHTAESPSGFTLSLPTGPQWPDARIFLRRLPAVHVPSGWFTHSFSWKVQTLPEASAHAWPSSGIAVEVSWI
jgi:hypothetical protein